MPGWVETIINIIVFFVALSLLILVHEAGHFACAKIFNVYCDDFSIGFGKAFFSKRKKGGETSFSLRVFPLGGFVAMAAEEGEIREGVVVPKERTLAGVAKWKGAIIMSAGIVVNIIVSILLLYVSNQAFITRDFINNVYAVEDGSLAYQAGLRSFDFETKEGTRVMMLPNYHGNNNNIAVISMNSYAVYKNGEKEEVVATFDLSDLGYKIRDIDESLEFFKKSTKKHESGVTYVVANMAEEIKADSYYKVKKDVNNDGKKTTSSEESSLVEDKTNPLDHIEINFNGYVPYSYDFDHNLKPHEHEHFYCVGCGEELTQEDLYLDGNKSTFHNNCKKPIMTFDERIDKESEETIHREVSPAVPNAKSANITPINLGIETVNDKLAFRSLGLSIYFNEYWQSFGEAWTNTFLEFGKGSSVIFKTIGNLFVGESWEDVGSIIKVFGEQANIIEKFDASKVFELWGLISVNLAIFNLLPFPGLDGWQLLVLGVEGITRKKIPEKVKIIVSYVGMALLLVFMVAIIIKDLIVIF